MKTVYVVWEWINNEKHIDCIFADEHKAIEYVARSNSLWSESGMSWSFQEWEVE